MKLIIILFVVLFTVLLAFIQGLQAKDRKANSPYTDSKLKTNWHQAQGLLHLLLALGVFLISIPNWWSASFGFFMALFIIWGVFDLLNNIISGNKAFYKGDNFIDNILKKIPVAVELIIKIALILVTTTYFITNPFK